VGGQVAGQQRCHQQDQAHCGNGGEIKPANAEEHALHGALHEVCSPVQEAGVPEQPAQAEVEIPQKVPHRNGSETTVQSSMSELAIMR
jgi:hypothetical protein